MMKAPWMIFHEAKPSLHTRNEKKFGWIHVSLQESLEEYQLFLKELNLQQKLPIVLLIGLNPSPYSKFNLFDGLAIDRLDIKW